MTPADNYLDGVRFLRIAPPEAASQYGPAFDLWLADLELRRAASDGRWAGTDLPGSTITA
jgi:hypothetical protein